MMRLFIFCSGGIIMLHVYIVEASGWVDGQFIHAVSDYHQSLEDCYDDLAEVVPFGICFEEFCY